MVVVVAVAVAMIMLAEVEATVAIVIAQNTPRGVIPTALAEAAILWIFVLICAGWGEIDVILADI